jgi:hypothetical protein
MSAGPWWRAGRGSSRRSGGCSGRGLGVGSRAAGPWPGRKTPGEPFRGRGRRDGHPGQALVSSRLLPAAPHRLQVIAFEALSDRSTTPVAHTGLGSASLRTAEIFHVSVRNTRDPDRIDLPPGPPLR